MADINYSQLEAIPIDYLVAAPLMATCRSNAALGVALYEFIKAIAYEKADDKAARVLTFTATKTNINPESKDLTSINIKITAPLLGLVPIPALLVESVDIKFTTTITGTSSLTSDTNIEIGGKYNFGAFQAHGNVTTDISTKRESNQSATYSFSIQARQQKQTEGMSRLMDAFSECTGITTNDDKQ